jgi:hypothetical protein
MTRGKGLAMTLKVNATVKNSGKTRYNSGKRELQSADRIREEGKCERLFYIPVRMAIG